MHCERSSGLASIAGPASVLAIGTVVDDGSEDPVTESGSSPARKAPAKKTAAKKTAAKEAAPGTAAKKSAARKSPASKKASRLDAARELARSAPMSTYFANARARARKILDDPEALKRVADESYRSGASRSGPFAAVMDDFRTLVRLVVAYARGNYRDIPPDSLALVVACLVYVVSPLDLLPDAVPVMGYMDDAVVVGWVIKSVREELDAFRAWEVGQ